jgi:hypothetical protein
MRYIVRLGKVKNCQHFFHLYLYLQFVLKSEYGKQRGQCILFSVVFTPPFPQPPRQCLLLSVVSLLLINTVSPVRTCLSISVQRF